MQMQTGPARNQSMRSWLAWTGWLEIFNVALFAFLIRQITGRWAYPAPYAWLGFATLGVVLLVGGGYWLLQRGGAFRRWSPAARLLAIRAAYWGTGLVFLAFPLAQIIGALLGWRSPAPGERLLGLALYLFAVGEYVHYFVVKINMRPREWRAAWRSGRPPEARFRRELRRARLAARRGATARPLVVP